MTATCATCGARWVGRRLCHCSTCHHTFTGIEAFDIHRTGPVDARRCDVSQLEQAQYGYWHRPRPNRPLRTYPHPENRPC